MDPIFDTSQRNPTINLCVFLTNKNANSTATSPAPCWPLIEHGIASDWLPAFILRLIPLTAELKR